MFLREIRLKDLTLRLITILPGIYAVASDGALAFIRAVGGVYNVSVSPDGLHIYAAKPYGNNFSGHSLDPLTGATGARADSKSLIRDGQLPKAVQGCRRGGF